MWIPIPVSDAYDMLRAKAAGGLEVKSFLVSTRFELLTSGAVRAELYLIGPRGEPVLIDRFGLGLGAGSRHSASKALDPSLFCPGIQFLYLTPLRGTTRYQRLYTEIGIEVVWSGAP